MADWKFGNAALKNGPAEEVPSAFGFDGRWQEFLPIALTNLALTIVTLGIYRFWGQVRERKYLWERSRFIDSPLEWTGTGVELFVGFLMGAALFGVPFLILQFGVQALMLQGHEGIAALVSIASFVFIYYVYGIAKFRAVRYRMGRTFWRGIRGGSDDPGLKYGWSYLWKNFVGMLPGGLLIPWSMVSLWNERWNAMSFGSHKFHASADFSDLMKRFLLFYLSPIIMVVVIAVIGGMALGAVGVSGGFEGDDPSIAAMSTLMVAIFVGVLLVYLIIPLIWLVYYAKFYRVVVAGMRLEKLEFAFAARTKDWLILFIGDFALWLLAALVSIVPIGLALAAFGTFDGLELPEPGETNAAFQSLITIGTLAVFFIPFALVGPFLRYRHWAFFMAHMQAFGEVDIASLTQSETRIAKHGEGLLDALDVGAI